MIRARNNTLLDKSFAPPYNFWKFHLHRTPSVLTTVLQVAHYQKALFLDDRMRGRSTICGRMRAVFIKKHFCYFFIIQIYHCYNIFHIEVFAA